jgi:hypothetical protein
VNIQNNVEDGMNKLTRYVGGAYKICKQKPKYADRRDKICRQSEQNM